MAAPVTHVVWDELVLLISAYHLERDPRPGADGQDSPALTREYNDTISVEAPC